MSYLDFLRDIGKHFSVNMMMAKDSVKSRLNNREQGISYTEFSTCSFKHTITFTFSIRTGAGSSSGGAISGATSRRGWISSGGSGKRRRSASTMPLITTASGQKFGKSEQGTIWLDPQRTSPYDFFQFFMKTDDRDVGKFLRYYTFLDEKRILELEETLRTAPEKREAVRVLAEEVTALVHGADEARSAVERSQQLFAKEGGFAGANLEPTRRQRRRWRGPGCRSWIFSFGRCFPRRGRRGARSREGSASTRRR